MNKIQRIIDELSAGPKTVDQFNVGISGVYLRSYLSALVELGMVHISPTWPRTYTLTKIEPDSFLPTEKESEELETAFNAMMQADIEMLNRERVGQHIVYDIRTAEPEDLLALKKFMGHASAKIQELLDNLESITVDDIVIKPLKERK